VAELDAAERRALLALARRALEAAVRGERDAGALPESAALRRPGGAFVTLRSHGALRGCIGHVAADCPLAEVVARMAASAATQDPRFPPIPPEELPALEVEISVLSEAVPLASRDPSEIRSGRDGVIVRRGWRQGVLLPQVAADHGWAGAEFLTAACRKAGLPPEAWRSDDCQLFVFETDVFSE
jgi:AmmeMemoRadiSam system protein A